MRSEGRKSIVTLVILTILIMIGAAAIVKYAQQMLIETKTQDIKTNMLLMQAETKKGLEEVCFHAVNLNESKEEDLTRINEIKNEYLKGTILSNSPEEVQEATKNVPDVTFDHSCYYLDETTLTEMGIEDVDGNQYGYFIVKYDFSNADVEVINTKGIDGKYILTQIVQEIEEDKNNEAEQNIEGSQS